MKEVKTKKEISILQKLKKNKPALDQFRLIFNDLCKKCKVKVIHNPKMDITSYCGHCRPRVKNRLRRINESLYGDN